MHVILAAAGPSATATTLDDSFTITATETIEFAELPRYVERVERLRPRWVWDSTAHWYPRLLNAGIRVERCVDLALRHAILRASASTAGSRLAREDDGRWKGYGATAELQHEDALFALEVAEEPARVDSIAEFRLQEEATQTAIEPGRMKLLLAAESAGSLIAAEMHHAGLPWRVDVHDALLTDLLGPRVPHGVRPRRMEHLAEQIRELLDSPALNPDSQAELLRALRAAGLVVATTRAWELRELEHPVIDPLLEYKKLARLLTANGWTWMDSWITGGRFHPDYVPGGVVTGRWATSGGGALQLPKQIRDAVRADDGWKLVVADAAQLEPRILTAISADTAMAAAGRGHDLYDGIVASGAVDTRSHAKVAMLGAMYGATSGDSGRLVPRLARAYPRAIALVEDAARTGERGDIVSTWLGRSSPRPGDRWVATQARASEPDATPGDERRARAEAREWGRFTRNFVVQGSAAEWALCWMAELRNRLSELGDDPAIAGAAAAPFTASPHLVFFLHDEVIVHTPAALADRVAHEVRAAAASVGALLFGRFPVEFPLSVAVVDSYADAK